MTIRPFFVEPGMSLNEWACQRIHNHKASVPLTPVTVVTPNHYAGLALRHHLSETGFINVHILVLDQLAEMLGGPRLASESRTPLTVASEYAAIRRALIESQPVPFLPAISHPRLITSLRQLFRSLRTHHLDDDTTLSELANRSDMLEAAVTVFRRFRALVMEHGLYDSVDMCQAAASGALDQSSHTLPLDVGPIMLLNPSADLTPSDAAFLRALSQRVDVDVAWRLFGDVEADLLSQSQAQLLGIPLPAKGTEALHSINAQVINAPSASEEVRVALRELLRAVEEDSSPLYRMAVLYKDEETYGRILRDTLTASGIRFSSLDGRPLSTSFAARTLLGLLRFVDADLSRNAVLEWLTSRVDENPDWPSPGQWERITREAGIVRGIEQWRSRLGQYIKKREFDLASDPDRVTETQKQYWQRQIDDTNTILKVIDNLAANTRPPEGRSWRDHVVWLNRLLDTYVPRDHSWRNEQLEARQMVAEIIAGLEDAGGIDAEVDASTCITMLTMALDSRRQPEGRLGTGIIIGPISATPGMDFDRVIVLGVTEDAFPSVQPIDPILPTDENDPLNRREARLSGERSAFLSAISRPTTSVTLCFSSWDAQRRPLYPSRWLVAIASDLAETPITGRLLRTHATGDWLIRVDSPLASLLATSFPLTQAERRLQEAARWSKQNIRLETSPLARRNDLPLQRALMVSRLRRSSRFTEYDGNVAEAVLDTFLSRGLEAFTTSPTGLETWAQCGFRYFMGRVLHIAPTEKPETNERWGTDRRVYGSLVHRILERFLRTLAEVGRPLPGEAYTTHDRELLHHITREESERIAGEGVTGHPLVWENEQASVRLDLETFLRKDPEIREGGFIPSAFEQTFGMNEDGSWPPVVVALEDGGIVRLRGYIDRVDFAPDRDAPTAAHVIDYKTGSETKQGDLDEDPVVAGTKLQLAVYGQAVQAFAGESGAAIREASGSYWFVSERGQFKLASVEASIETKMRLTEVVHVIDEGIRKGAFLAVPGDETYRPTRPTTWENCVYCDYDRICPASRELVYERKHDDGDAALHLSLARDPLPHD